MVSNENGGSEINDVRTSNGMFLRRGQDAVVSAVEDRIARWTLMPEGHGEGLQVLRYGPSQEYREHWDYFFNKVIHTEGGLPARKLRLLPWGLPSSLPWLKR